MEQMTTDIAVLERALIVIAVSLAVQTLLCLGAAVVAVVAWRRATAALADAKAVADAQVAELRAHLIRITASVEETGRALRRGSTAADDLIGDMRNAVGTVRDSVGSVASVVSAPRAALAIGLWRGLQMWRKRRASRDVDATVTTEG
jgi:hypothetical protein